MPRDPHRAMRDHFTLMHLIALADDPGRGGIDEPDLARTLSVAVRTLRKWLASPEG